MSQYGLQKLIRDVNRTPATREAFMADPASVFPAYDLTGDEAAALAARDWGKLYRLGVHGLLLRPFSILHKLPEADYLRAIREPA